MQFVVAVKTHNPVAGLRMSQLHQTVTSVERAFPTAELLLYDNGSFDGSEDEIHSICDDRWGVTLARGEDGYTPGHGENGIMRLVTELYDHCQVVVVSDDDMDWYEGAEDRLRRFWLDPPAEIVIVCGLMEPLFDWNAPLYAASGGGERVLVRESVPGSGWSFLLRDWGSRIGPVNDKFGYDYDECCKIRDRGHQVAAMDLAEHLGWHTSTHGNDAIRLARPLDRERWGV
jgi:hypothetical protein